MRPSTNTLATARSDGRLLPCLLLLPLAWAFTQDHDTIPEEPDVDPYFRGTSGISSDTGPQVITRNILQDRQGDFWLATWNGILRYDGSTFTNITNKEGLRRYRGFSLMEDAEGNIWLGTTGAGVYRYDGTAYTNFTTEDGLVDDTVLSMFQDRDGILWFGALGLTQVRRHRVHLVHGSRRLHQFRRALHRPVSRRQPVVRDAGCTVPLRRKDVRRTSPRSTKWASMRNSYTPVRRSTARATFGSVARKGIYHYDGEQCAAPLPASRVSRFFEDSQGNIWFSGGGLEGDEPKPGTSVLNRFDPSAGLEDILAASKRFEIENGALFGLTEDKDGKIWFGTGSGVGRIDGDRVQYY